MGEATIRPRPPVRHGGRGAGRRLGVGLGITAVVGLLVWLTSAPRTDSGGAGAPVEDFLHVHGLAVPIWAEGAVYVATHQGVFRIDGDGWTWVSEQRHDLMGFAAHPDEAGVLFSSGHPAPGTDLPNPIGFTVSVDHGATWEPRALTGEVDLHAMAVSTRDGDVVFGYDGRHGLLRSVDGGHEWERPAAEGLRQAGGALSLAAGTGDHDEVLAGTEAGLLRSTDAGTSWEALLGAPVSAVSVDAADPDRILAYAATEEDGGLLVSEDGGDTWRPLGLVLEDDVAGHIAADPADPATVWVGTWGQDLWRTTDGGRQWEQLADAGTVAPQARRTADAP